MRKSRHLLLTAAALLSLSLPASAAWLLASGFEEEGGAVPDVSGLVRSGRVGSLAIAGPNVQVLAATRVVQFDLGGLSSYDALHIPGNVRFTLELAAHEHVSQIEVVITGIDNDPGVGTDGGSWPSEARLAVHNDEGEIYLDIPLYSSPAYDHNGTTDAPDLPTLFMGAALAHPGFHGPSRMTVQLYETLDDAPGIADGVYRPGSYILITIVPEPTAALLLAAGLPWLMRRRLAV